MPAITHHTRRSTQLLATIAASSALLLGGCATTAASGGDPEETSAPAGSAYPLTIDNCGTELTLDAAPARVVTIKSSTLELLLALGLGDRIVGSAFTDGPVPEEFTTIASDIPLISDKVPSQEVTLATEPDFIYAGWESNLTAEGAGERADLAKLGVDTYVAPAACKGDGYMPDPLEFSEVFREFAEVGVVFNVPDAADSLISEQEAALAEIEPNTDGLTALWYSSGKDTPFVGAGIGSPQMIMGAAGLVNIGAEVKDSWTSMSWEVIVDENPDVIVLVDSSWNTAESKIEYLESNPITSILTAVQEKRYVILDFAATEAGVRNVGAVASTVEQLKELGL
ncbi:iron transport system substrate-binding protein [marine actinobacterium PHSC20C1]|nr:iron transport system substrate-binding protein [marine actinobacterium PHSC20C1]